MVTAYPERSEYISLTSLQNLVDLQISYATNFGDTELYSLTNLVALRNLYIYADGCFTRRNERFQSYAAPHECPGQGRYVCALEPPQYPRKLVTT